MVYSLQPIHLAGFIVFFLPVTPTDVTSSAHSRGDAKLWQDNQLKQQPDHHYAYQPNKIFHPSYCAIGRPAAFHASVPPATLIA